MIIRGTCCSTRCVHFEPNNECYWSKHLLIYQGQCLKYEKKIEKINDNKCPEGYGCPRYCNGRCGYCGHGFSTMDGISVCLKHSKQISHLDNHCENFTCIKLGRFKFD
jgi:hypothetical protein